MAIALARKFRLDVTADLTLGSGWLQLMGVNDFDDGITPSLEDSTTYDTSGQKTSEVTLQEVKPNAKFLRRMSGGIYDPGAEIVRTTRLQFGDQARIGMRWYDRLNGPEAYQSVFIPTWDRSATGVANLEEVTLGFELCDVPCVPITNPLTGTLVPVITKANPAAQSVGNLIVLTGGGFTGATQVAIGGVVVTVASGKASVLSDNTLVFVVPTGTAGSAPIIVTNGAGASASFAYTRGA